MKFISYTASSSFYPFWNARIIIIIMTIQKNVPNDNIVINSKPQLVFLDENSYARVFRYQIPYVFLN